MAEHSPAMRRNKTERGSSNCIESFTASHHSSMTTNAQANTEAQGEGCGFQERELRHVQSNLHSLKKLYGLLYAKENDPNRISSENLDEKARILLKKLLDGATELALQTYSKIISRQLGTSLTSKELMRPDNQQSLENNFRSQDPELSCHSTTKEEDNQSLSKHTSQAIIGGETGKLEFTATDQSLNTWSGSQMCQKCNRKRPNSVKVKTSDGEIQKPTTRDRHVHENSCDKKRLKRVREMRVGSEPGYEIQADESNKKTEKLIDVSKEVARAIQQIEAEIQVDQSKKLVGLTNDTAWDAWMIQKKDMATQTTEVKSKTDKKNTKNTTLQGQLLSQTLHAVGTSRLMSQSLPRQRMSQASRKIKEPALADQFLSQACKAVLDTNELPSQMPIYINKGSMTSPDLSKGVKSISKQKNELPGRLMSQKDLTMSQSGKQSIHTILDSPNQKARKPIEAYKESSPVDHTRQREKISEIGKSIPSKPLQIVGPTLMRNESLNPRPKYDKSEKMPKTKQGMISKRNLPHQITKRPSFCDQNVGPRRSKGPSYQADSGIRNPLPHQQKAKVIRAMDDSDSCYTWTSKDNYTDESEDPPIYHEMEPTSSQDSYTSDSEDPLIYHQVGPTSRQMGPNRYAYASVSTPAHKAHPKETIGRWRRIKDKLAIVFHHHHHHHHNQVSRVAPNHQSHQSLKKYWPQILHRPSKENHRKLMTEIYGERVAERIPRQHQQGHFHMLLDGLLRHVWHSKKSKQSVTRVKRLGKVPKYGQVAKKLHWWQKLRRRGVKVANSAKPRVKLGFKTKGRHLQVGKMS